MTRLVITTPAENDLVDIWWHIAQRHPENGERYVAKLRDRAESLAKLPRKGRPRDDLIPGCRAITVDNILIAYRIVDDTVEILHFVDARRNLNSDMFAE